MYAGGSGRNNHTATREHIASRIPSLTARFRRKSYLLSAPSISVLPTLETCWQLYCTLSSENNTAPTMLHWSEYAAISQITNKCNSVRHCFQYQRFYRYYVLMLWMIGVNTGKKKCWSWWMDDKCARADLCPSPMIRFNDVHTTMYVYSNILRVGEKAISIERKAPWQ